MLCEVLCKTVLRIFRVRAVKLDRPISYVTRAETLLLMQLLRVLSTIVLLTDNNL